MNEALDTLQPTKLFQYFKEILSVPRPSKKEEKMTSYLLSWGRKHGLETHSDAVGNVLMRKPATPGYESQPWICLQSHIDMVCEKNSDKDFNFETDTIETHIEDGWLKANGTTLGADDGIGVAAALAVLASDDIAHGPLECLFTVDEETGLTGANAIGDDFLKSRILLNLDSEDEGEIFIGCAGGKDTVAKIAFHPQTSPKGYAAFQLMVKGLCGGHSGDDINKGLGCANKILNRMLWLWKDTLLLSHIDGGNLRNAIAREAFAVVLVPQSRCGEWETFVKQFTESVQFEYRTTEPNLMITLTPVPVPAEVTDHASFLKLTHSVYACPHGVLSMSREIPDFVETSTNLASIKISDRHFVITTSQRSSVESSKEDACNMVEACFLSVGAEVWHGDGYPGWAPNPDSKILSVAVQTYESLFGKRPVVRAIHAGLECGLIGEKYSGMDMISYGPTLRGVHSPDERLEISTVQKFWDHTLAILKTKIQ